jgi:excisionase family DNA binding protein
MNTVEEPAGSHAQPRTRGDILAKARAARGTQHRPRQEPALPEIEPLALRIPAAARAVGIGVSTMKELVYSGRIRSLKLGTSRVIPVTALQRFLDGK